MTGHTARTCATAITPSLDRTKEVLDGLFGKDRNKEELAEQRSYHRCTPRILYAPRGPRFLSDGSYAQPYRFSPRFAMALDGTVTHVAQKAVAAHA